MRRLAQIGAKVVIADASGERGEALAREVGAGSLYVPTDARTKTPIAEAVKVAAGLGPLRAAVITHIGPDWPVSEMLARANAGPSSSGQRAALVHRLRVARAMAAGGVATLRDVRSRRSASQRLVGLSTVSQA